MGASATPSIRSPLRYVDSQSTETAGLRTRSSRCKFGRQLGARAAPRIRTGHAGGDRKPRRARRRRRDPSPERAGVAGVAGAGDQHRRHELVEPDRAGDARKQHGPVRRRPPDPIRSLERALAGAVEWSVLPRRT